MAPRKSQFDTLHELEQDPIAPVYGICGEEGYFREEALRILRDRIVDPVGIDRSYLGAALLVPVFMPHSQVDRLRQLLVLLSLVLNTSQVPHPEPPRP